MTIYNPSIIMTTIKDYGLGVNGAHASHHRHNGNMYIACTFYMDFILGIS
jgi:hypothetical protein